MRNIILALACVLGITSAAEAQFSLRVGGGYYRPGVRLNIGYGYPHYYGYGYRPYYYAPPAYVAPYYVQPPVMPVIPAGAVQVDLAAPAYPGYPIYATGNPAVYYQLVP